MEFDYLLSGPMLRAVWGGAVFELIGILMPPTPEWGRLTAGPQASVRKRCCHFADLAEQILHPSP